MSKLDRPGTRRVTSAGPVGAAARADCGMKFSDPRRFAANRTVCPERVVNEPTSLLRKLHKLSVAFSGEFNPATLYRNSCSATAAEGRSNELAMLFTILLPSSLPSL